MNTVNDLTIRPMFQRDLKDILKIEHLKPDACPWLPQHFLPVFEAPDTEGWVGEVGNALVGFLVFKVVSAPNEPLRIAVRNLGVAPEWQQKGIIRTMLEKLEEKLRESGKSIQDIAQHPELSEFLRREDDCQASEASYQDNRQQDAYLAERQPR
jgi:ribosomal protein S18 acetylase RimI-like enzyme